MSVELTILHLASSLVTPLTPSIVEPVQADIKLAPAIERLLTTVV
jgi:hypothetical protein